MLAPIMVCVVYGLILWLIPDGRRIWFNGESGPVEIITAVLFLIIAVEACRLTARLRGRPLPRRGIIRFWFALFVVGGVFMFLEEVSYGQHWLGFESPEFFAEHNKQQEFSLHNLAGDKPSSLLRRLMEIGLPIFGIALPMAHLLIRGSYTPGNWPYYLLPKLEMAVWIGAAALTRPIRKEFELGGTPLWEGSLSEFQELLWAAGLWLYIRVMSRRLLAESPAGNTDLVP